MPAAFAIAKTVTTGARSMTAAGTIAAYHAMRAAKDAGEHMTAAELLGLDLEERELVVRKGGRAARTGPTLRERIAAFRGVEEPSRRPAAPTRRQRESKRIPDHVIARNAALATAPTTSR